MCMVYFPHMVTGVVRRRYCRHGHPDEPRNSGDHWMYQKCKFYAAIEGTGHSSTASVYAGPFDRANAAKAALVIARGMP